MGHAELIVNSQRSLTLDTAICKFYKENYRTWGFLNGYHGIYKFAYLDRDIFLHVTVRHVFRHEFGSV